MKSSKVPLTKMLKVKLWASLLGIDIQFNAKKIKFSQ
jgi:hypothetical protein